jgi:hypothetical protein
VTPEQEAARERLWGVMPHLKIASAMAKIQVPDGEAVLAVLGKRADGSGEIIASFDSAEFFADIEILIGPDPLDAKLP